MKTVKIFLASSHELFPERDRLLEHVTKLNSSFEQRGISIKLVRWEELDGYISTNSKQNKYNKELKKCDICLALFWRKYGSRTAEEVDLAYKQMCEGKVPEIIFVYFKTVNPPDIIDTELQNYQDTFEQSHKDNYYSRFDNEYDLVVKFFLDLERYLSEQLGKNFVTVHQGDVYIGGEEIVKLSDLPFIIKNDNYQEKQKELEKLFNEITDLESKLDKKQLRLKKRKEKMEMNPDDKDYQEEYKEAKDDVIDCLRELHEKIVKKDEQEKQFEDQQKFIIDVARKFTKLRGQNCTERIKRAKDAFDNGDVEKADHILDQARKDTDNILADILASKKAGLQKIDELNLAAYVKRANGAIELEKRKQETLQIYEKADALAKECNYDKKEYINLLFDYGEFLKYYAFYDKALEVFERLVKMSVETYGTEDSITASSFNNIGTVYDEMREYDKAIEYYMKDLTITEKVLGPDHPLTAISYNNIGVVYKTKCEYDKALEYHKKSVEIREKVFGPDHPTTATSYNNIGMIYYDKGEYDKALEYQRKAMSIYEKVLGLEHPLTATSYNNIGMVYKAKGEHGKALDYYMKSLAIREKVLGLNHPATATSYNNIAGVYYSKGDYGKALDYYKKSVAIREKIFGLVHQDTAYSYNNIGMVYKAKGEYEKALKYLMKAKDICDTKLPEKHPLKSATYRNIVNVNLDKGEYDKAKECIDKT